jgi:hypothetical protein
MGTFISSLY